MLMSYQSPATRGGIVCVSPISFTRRPHHKYSTYTRRKRAVERGVGRASREKRFVWHPHRCQPRRRGRERELNLDGDLTVIPMAQHASEQLWATTGGEEQGKRRHREWVIAYTSSRLHICSRCGLVGQEDPSGTGLCGFHNKRERER